MGSLGTFCSVSGRGWKETSQWGVLAPAAQGSPLVPRTPVPPLERTAVRTLDASRKNKGCPPTWLIPEPQELESRLPPRPVAAMGEPPEPVCPHLAGCWPGGCWRWRPGEQEKGGRLWLSPTLGLKPFLTRVPKGQGAPSVQGPPRDIYSAAPPGQGYRPPRPLLVASSASSAVTRLLRLFSGHSPGLWLCSAQRSVPPSPA